ncbi:unnamed protein product [Thlaspi arvense]|uniref:Peptidase C1A papain C-terminal domain-containing protein n=1 Tax=Thlaspi arvense TaxID=13288 RepID=A0AAU9T2C1_THLAR|nr:unnamed protein product [Thlaspi arvense]
MDIGGKRSEKDDRKKNKGKEKQIVEEEIAEEEMPRNRKYMDCPVNWDWRLYLGIISNVLTQKHHLICWAIAFIRSVEALFNIGKRLEDQKSFSIQHLINNIEIGSLGLKESTDLGKFVAEKGILEEAECSYTRAKDTCVHENPKMERIDRLVVIKEVDDVDLARLVWKHPVVGVVPLWSDFESYKSGIYRPQKEINLQLHAILILGFGVDEHGNYYWIIQNSGGRNWGEGGFGRLYRESRRGKLSTWSQNMELWCTLFGTTSLLQGLGTWCQRPDTTSIV